MPFFSKPKFKFSGILKCFLNTVASDNAGTLDMLQINMPRVPGENYPTYAEVPVSGFTCDGQVDRGHYSDPECQALHICIADGAGDLAKYSL